MTCPFIYTCGEKINRNHFKLYCLDSLTKKYEECTAYKQIKTEEHVPREWMGKS